MIYYIICSFIIALFFFFIADAVVADLKQCDKRYTIIFTCAILTLLYRFCWGSIFWGLEYEDSFAFSFLAREFSEGIFTNSFLSEGIIAGSIEHPLAMGQYGGHFITYSVFVSYFFKLFGYSPLVFSFVTTILSFFSLIILSLFSKANSFSWWIAPVLYCSAPIINVFSNTFLCEPFSSFVILSFIYSIFNNKSITLILICFFLAILCKRENTVLVLLPIMLGLFECKPFNVKSIAKKILPYCIIVLIYLIFVQNIFNIEATESKDIQSATFSINYMKVLLPLFLKALLSINYFSITVYLFIVVTAFYFFSTRKDSKKLLSLMILFLAYIALYTFHYRGFYFVTYGKVSIFESFRYLNNCYVIIPVSIALSMKWICSKVSMRVLSSFLGVLLVFSIVQTYILRTNLSEKEQENRWKDVKTVLSFIGDDNDNDKKVLISEDILLYQNECSPSFAVLDIRLINEVKVDKSIKKYLVLKDTDARYKVKIKSDSLKLITPLVNGGLYEY